MVNFLKPFVWAYANIRWVYVAIQSMVAYTNMANEDKETTSRGELVIRTFLDEECAKLHVGKPHLVVGRVNKCNAAGYCIGEYLLHIDPAKRPDVRHVLCHELRHAWQWKYHHDIFFWCQWYFPQSDGLYWVNPVEADARYYELHGTSSGLMDIPLETFKKMHLEGTLNEYLKDAIRALGMDRESYLRQI